MFNWLDKTPYWLIAAVAGFLMLAPFRPMPHLMEKLIMLMNGTLTKPMDIFDLLFHLAPTMLLAVKWFRVRNR